MRLRCKIKVSSERLFTKCRNIHGPKDIKTVKATRTTTEAAGHLSPILPHANQNNDLFLVSATKQQICQIGLTAANRSCTNDKKNEGFWISVKNLQQFKSPCHSTNQLTPTSSEQSLPPNLPRSPLTVSASRPLPRDQPVSSASHLLAPLTARPSTAWISRGVDPRLFASCVSGLVQRFRFSLSNAQLPLSALPPSRAVHRGDHLIRSSHPLSAGTFPTQTPLLGSLIQRPPDPAALVPPRETEPMQVVRAGLSPERDGGVTLVGTVAR